MQDDTYMLIERYIAGELDAQEQKAFEERIKSDADFSEKVGLYRSASEHLAARFRNEDAERILAKNLTHIAENHLPADKSDNVISLRWYHWAVAASIAIVCIVLFTSSPNKPEYSAYAEHAPLALTVRGENDSIKQQAEQAFNAKNYEQALLHLNQLLEADKNNTELQLFKGIAVMELDRAEEADAIFNTIRNSTTSYNDKALWYQGLNALKQKDYERCKTLLKELPESSEDYTKAQEIINDLK
jgi:anti-sigma-K factor RskA